MQLFHTVHRLLVKALRKTPLDATGDRTGISDGLSTIGLGTSLSAAIGKVLGIVVTLMIVITAISALGLKVLDEPLAKAILFLPRLIVAIILIVIGAVLARKVSAGLTRAAERLDLPGPLPMVGQAVILIVVGLIAASEIGIPTSMLTVILAIVLGSVALTVALAFGLGGREVARQVGAGRSVASSYKLGDHIAVGETQGEVTAFERTATVLRTGDGRTLRVPNSVLLDSVVTVVSSP